MMPKLSIHADLEIITEDARIRIDGDGGQSLNVQFPSPRSLFQFWRRHGGVLRPIVDRVPGVFDNSVGLLIFIGEREIARLGAGAHPNLLSRLVFAAPIQINSRNLARALLS
jgi:hypothetical protein